MKKSTFILAAFIILSSAVSCKKDYQCKCEVTSASGNISTMSTNIKATKKKAQEECESSFSYPASDMDCTVN